MITINDTYNNDINNDNINNGNNVNDNNNNDNNNSNNNDNINNYNYNNNNNDNNNNNNNNNNNDNNNNTLKRVGNCFGLIMVLIALQPQAWLHQLFHLLTWVETVSLLNHYVHKVMFQGLAVNWHRYSTMNSVYIAIMCKYQFSVQNYYQASI